MFDSNVNIDWIILTEIKQTPVFKNIDTEVQYNEYSFAINKLTLHIASEDNSISRNAIKALDKENINFLFAICSEIFEDKVNIEEWQIGVLKILPKKEIFPIPTIGRVLIY